MQQFLAEQRHWLEVRRLPGYAAELNPVEGLWSNRKARELANRCDTTQDHLLATVTASTVFADTRSLLRTWFATAWYVTGQKQGVSALDVACHEHGTT